MKIHNTNKTSRSAPHVSSGTGDSKPAIFQLRGLQEMADNSIGARQGKEVQFRAVQYSRGRALQLKGSNTAPIQMVTKNRMEELIIDNGLKDALTDISKQLMNKYKDRLNEVEEDEILREIEAFKRNKDQHQEEEEPPLRLRHRKKRSVKRRRTKEEQTEDGVEETVFKRKKKRKRKREGVVPQQGSLHERETPVKRRRKLEEDTEDGVRTEEDQKPASVFSDHRTGNKLLNRKNAWLSKARRLKRSYKNELKDISDKKIAIVLLIYKQGIFSGMGEGGNTKYIRSKNNLILLLMGYNLSEGKNTEGKLPDMYKDITPDEFIKIVTVLKKEQGQVDKEKEAEAEKEEENDVLQKSETKKDEYIQQQRLISQSIINALGKDGAKYSGEDIKPPLPVMAYSFEGNYPPVNIHFPALYAYISKKDTNKTEQVGAITYSTISKFIMARLISAYNAESGEKPFLTEKSSFSFKLPTVADLGHHLSIRLSPGIYETAVQPLAKALRLVEREVYEMMMDKETLQIHTGGREPSQNLSAYWDDKTDKRMQGLNAEKTVLDHLLFTLTEKGPKIIPIIASVLERDPQNILALSSINAPLKEIGKEILKLHSLADLEASLKKRGKTAFTMRSPQMLSNSVVNKLTENEQPDHEARRRLALMSAIAKDLSMKPLIKDKWEEDASDSEFDEDEEEDVRVSGNKIIVPSGMSSLYELLDQKQTADSQKQEDSEVPPKIKPKTMKGNMASDTYYEFSKYAGKEFAVAGYQANEVHVVDLNPNREKPSKTGRNIIDTTEVSEQVAQIVGHLTMTHKKVWVIDITSSITAEQNFVYRQWRADANAELIIFISSGLKNEQDGLNMNTYGTIHWAYKHPAEEDKIEELKNYFDSKKKLDSGLQRSAIGNRLRRHFKTRGGVKWDRIKGKRSGINSNKDKDKDKDEGNG